MADPELGAPRRYSPANPIGFQVDGRPILRHRFAMSCTIRRATREDVPELLRLIRGLADFEDLEPPTPEAEARMIAHGFDTDRPKFEAWLAYLPEQDTPVAYAILFETYSTFLAKPTLYLEDVYVEEAHRKQGIGMAMLKHVVTLAKERDCGRVEWTALDWNTNAQRVYEDKLGAQHLKEWFLYRMTEKEIDGFLG